MRLPVLCCTLSLFALTSCDTSGDVGSATTAAASTTTADQPDTTTDVTSSSLETATGAGFSVAALGLTFSLADSYEQEADGDYAFSALSVSPRSFFTIYAEPPDIADHPPRPGEELQSIDLGPGITAVVVLDAAIEGLPAGVSANELLVSNGDRSFSVIMSSISANLDEFWSVFIASVQVAAPA
ncbi:MAG: hypothetical protein ABMA25_21670 [Ilumatobacteraceae bacterium]